MIKRSFIGLAVLFGTAALAQGRAPTPTPPTKPADVVLNCPASTRQVGGPSSFMEASGCVRYSRDGGRIFHGPYVAYWKDGVKQAEGQYEQGFRSGKWVFFDEKGLKTGETNFKMGDYDGLRVEFWANGQKKLEETYVMGKRQGTQRLFDEAGKVLSQTEFIDDRPAAK